MRSRCPPEHPSRAEYTKQLARTRAVGRAQRGDVWLLAEVDLAEAGNLHDWRVIVIRTKGRRAVTGNLRAFGVEESFNEAKRRALHTLREEMEPD